MDYYGSNINLKSISKTNEVAGRQEIVYEYEGLPTAINSLRQQLLNKQDRPQRIEIEDTPPTQILRAYYSGFENTKDIIYRWELIQSDIEENILLHPVMAYFPVDIREIFRAYMEGRIIRDEHEPTIGQLDGRPVIFYEKKQIDNNGQTYDVYNIVRVGDFNDIFLQEAAIKILNYISMGQTSYYRTQTILRRTTNLQNINNKEFIDDYKIQSQFIGQVVAHSILQATFDLPSELITILPEPIYYNNPSFSYYFSEGWLVKGMQSTIEADGSWEIVQEFLWGYWSSLFYGAVKMVNNVYTLK